MFWLEYLNLTLQLWNEYVYERTYVFFIVDRKELYTLEIHPEGLRISDMLELWLGHGLKPWS